MKNPKNLLSFRNNVKEIFSIDKDGNFKVDGKIIEDKIEIANFIAESLKIAINSKSFRDPKALKTEHTGACYTVPTYTIDDSGIVDGPEVLISFCKGNKDDPNKLRQTGFFTETLIQVAKQYLEDVNKGELSSRETSMAITKLDEALMWLNKRKEDRELRNVLATDKK